MKRVPLIVWFAMFVALATAVAGPAVAAYEARRQRVSGSPLSLGRQRLYGWADVLGARFQPDRILPSGNAGSVLMFGAFGRPELSPGGLSLRVSGRGPADGFFFVDETDPSKTYRVAIEGANVRGAASVQIRCQSDADLDRQQGSSRNLLNESPAPKRPIWEGAAVVTPGVAGPSGRNDAVRIVLTNDKGYTYQTSDTMTSPGDEEIDEFTFSGRVVSGGPSVQVVVNRAGGYDSRPVTETFTSEWRRYSIVHAASWTGATQAQVAFNRADADATIEIAGPRLTVRRARVDTPAPWMLKGWTPSGEPDPSVGVSVPLATGKAASVQVSGARQLALLLSGSPGYEYRIDAVKLTPAAAATPAGTSCSISQTP